MTIHSEDIDKTNFITIKGPDGENLEFDGKLFLAQVREANGYHRAIEGQKVLLKKLVDTVSEQTGLPKGFVSKYFKARYDESTEAAANAGSAIASLDEALETV